MVTTNDSDYVLKINKKITLINKNINKNSDKLTKILKKTGNKLSKHSTNQIIGDFLFEKLLKLNNTFLKTDYICKDKWDLDSLLDCFNHMVMNKKNHTSDYYGWYYDYDTNSHDWSKIKILQCHNHFYKIVWVQTGDIDYLPHDWIITSNKLKWMWYQAEWHPVNIINKHDNTSDIQFLYGMSYLNNINNQNIYDGNKHYLFNIDDSDDIDISDDLENMDEYEIINI